MPGTLQMPQRCQLRNKEGLRSKLHLATVAHFGDSSTRVAVARESGVQSQPELQWEAGTGYMLCLKETKHSDPNVFESECEHHREGGGDSLHWLKINPRDAVDGEAALSGR